MGRDEQGRGAEFDLLLRVRARRTATTAARLGGKTAGCLLLRLPAAHAGRAHAQTPASFPMRRTTSDSINNPLAKIDRQGSRHQGTLRWKRTLNQRKTDLETSRFNRVG
jgi:hypothetical protein